MTSEAGSSVQCTCVCGGDPVPHCPLCNGTGARRVEEVKELRQLCSPRGQLRCWQYRKDSNEPIPRWTLGALCWDGDSRPELLYDGNSSGDYMQEGDWLVELDGGTHPDTHIACYSDEDFRKYFEVPRE